MIFACSKTKTFVWNNESQEESWEWISQTFKHGHAWSLVMPSCHMPWHGQLTEESDLVGLCLGCRFNGGTSNPFHHGMAWSLEELVVGACFGSGLAWFQWRYSVALTSLHTPIRASHSIHPCSTLLLLRCCWHLKKGMLTHNHFGTSACKHCLLLNPVSSICFWGCSFLFFLLLLLCCVCVAI